MDAPSWKATASGHSFWLVVHYPDERDQTIRMPLADLPHLLEAIDAATVPVPAAAPTEAVEVHPSAPPAAVAHHPADTHPDETS